MPRLCQSKSHVCYCALLDDFIKWAEDEQDHTDVLIQSHSQDYSQSIYNAFWYGWKKRDKNKSNCVECYALMVRKSKETKGMLHERL